MTKADHCCRLPRSVAVVAAGLLLLGNGKRLLFHAGEVVHGTWCKDGLGAGVELQARNGDALTVPAGHTWIELVPVDGGSVAY